MTESKKSQVILVESCLALALATSLSCGLLISIFFSGHFQNFEPQKLISFVVNNLSVWRFTWLSLCLTSLVQLLFVQVYSQTIPQEDNTWSRFFLMLALIACASSLSANVSMLVQFSDLSNELANFDTYNHTSTIHLSWLTLCQAFNQEILISNTLYGIAVLNLSLLWYSSEELPKIIAWLGIVYSLLACFTSLLAFLGQINLALLLLFVSKLSIIIFATVCGIRMSKLRNIIK